MKTYDLVRQLARVLDAARIDQKLSVRQLAARSCMPLRTVQKTLSGDSVPRLDTLLLILRALGHEPGVSLAWLESSITEPGSTR